MPRLRDDELAELKELFKHYDADSNGTIDVIEFAQLCEALGGGFNEEEVEIGFIAVDTNRNGVIEFSEFVEWWQNR